MEEMYKFKARITYQTYYNHDTLWGVYGFSTDDDIPYCVKRSVDPFASFLNNNDNNGIEQFGTIAGKMQELFIGSEYIISATHKKDKKYGDQFVPISIKSIVPKTIDKQLLFLSALTTESRARAIIDQYPNIVEDVINGDISDIDYSKVKGVGKATWNLIKEKIIDNYVISDIIEMLQPLGVSMNVINRLIKSESNPNLLKVKLENNPYILTDIKGIGFIKCDDLAIKLKPQLKKSKERLVSFVTYLLREIGENEGHTWVNSNRLKEEVLNTIPECLEYYNWLIDPSNKLLVVHDGKVGLRSYYNVENCILDKLIIKSSTSNTITISNSVIENAIKKSEQEQGFNYTEEQINVIHNVLNNNLSIVVGGGGVGKSTVLRAIINAYILNGNVIKSSALSAMAAQRISEATSYQAETIHRTLGYDGITFRYNEENLIPADVVFMDEGSMVNASLFLSWLNAIGDSTKIIICGDNKQLPPIGYGNIFSDIIDILPQNSVNRLTKTMRQAELSGILHDANIVRANKTPVLKEEGYVSKLIHGDLKDMYYMFRDNRETLFSIAIKTYLKTVDELGINNVVIITPRRENTLNSALEINKRIQEELLHDETLCVTYGDRTYKLGAKVMQVKNNYEKGVVNGQLGFIKSIVNDKSKITVDIEYDDVRTNEKILVQYDQNELDEIDFGYALTVHKIQGGARHTVIGIIDNTHFSLLDNCMLYTLMTRAKKRCLLLAEPSAFQTCIRTSHNSRNTWLSLVDKNLLNNTIKEN